MLSRKGSCGGECGTSKQGYKGLYLNLMGIPNIVDRTFDGLSILQFLHVDHNNLPLGINNLYGLPAGTFDKLSSLQYVYLDNNKLSCLPLSLSPIVDA